MGGGFIPLIEDINVFKGAERLDIKGRSKLSFYRPVREEPVKLFFEWGLDASLRSPRISIPFLNINRNNNLSKFQPSTFWNLSFLSQHRSEYDRVIVGANWEYNWYHNSIHRKNKSSFSPLIITYINSDLSQGFRDQIESIDDPFLQQFVQLDFKSRFSSKTQYKFTHSDYMSTKAHSTQFFQPIAQIGEGICHSLWIGYGKRMETIRIIG